MGYKNISINTARVNGAVVYLYHQYITVLERVFIYSYSTYQTIKKVFIYLSITHYL